MSLLRWSAAGLIAAFELCSSAPALADGDPLCEGKTDCRALTSSEVKFAKTIFGGSIDYKDVRIVNVPSNIFAMYASATAHGSNIHYHEPTMLSDDHAKKSAGNRKMLVHELTHVWQHQHGMDVRALGLALLLRYPMNYSAAYKYELSKPFTAYNMEQQAKIVEHYAVARETYRNLKDSLAQSSGKKRSEIKADMETVCNAMAARYEILAPYFSLAPHRCNRALQ